MAGAEVVGIDPGVNGIRVANEHLEITKKQHPKLNVTYVCETIEDHVENYSNHYDVVVSSEVVEHVPDPQNHIAYCIKALKPGGSIFVTTINRTISSFIFAWLIFEMILGMIPRGNHSWPMFVKPEEIEQTFYKNNCHKVGLTGFLYQIWNHGYRYHFDKSLQFGIHGMKNIKFDDNDHH
jgi:ubiquinone biosynthesis O-methyltransferase